MGRLGALGKLLGPSDAAVNWAVRIYVLYTLGISTIVSAVVGAGAWFAQNFVYGVWAFFGTWILVTVLQAVRVFTRFPPETAQAEPEAKNAASQPAAEDAEIYGERWQDLEQEKEEFRTKLQESEQKREKLRVERDTLQKRLAALETSPVSEHGSVTDIVGKAIREGINPAPATLAAGEAQQLREKLERVRSESERLRTERDEFRKESEQAKAGRDDQLRARCFDLSGQLLEFLEDVRREYPEHYHNETMPRYEIRLVGSVTNVIQALKQHGWWNPTESERLENPLQWEDLRSLADYLRNIGLGFGGA